MCLFCLPLLNFSRRLPRRVQTKNCDRPVTRRRRFQAIVEAFVFLLAFGHITSRKLCNEMFSIWLTHLQIIQIEVAYNSESLRVLAVYRKKENNCFSELLKQKLC
jgi:hypothetical protein